MMAQVLYFVDGLWKPNQPMTLHWLRPPQITMEKVTVSGSSSITTSNSKDGITCDYIILDPSIPSTPSTPTIYTVMLNQP